MSQIMHPDIWLLKKVSTPSEPLSTIKLISMQKLFFPLIVLLSLFACQEKSNLVSRQIPIQIVPVPKMLDVGEQWLVLTTASATLTSTDEALLPLLYIFREDLMALSNLNPTALPNLQDATVSFKIDPTYAEDAYRIEIEDKILVKAGSYQAAAMARASLLQMAHAEEGKILFPQLALNDNPDAKYRGLMIDLARSWHPMKSVKKLIDLASYYKTNYIQLHFTDDQSYTLPSNKFPNLPTPERHYSFSDLRELERYSQERGVTIIPEIEMPGHANALVTAYPELFGIADFEENPYIINMGKEEVYTALDELIAEIVPIFKATPYFHIGGDEAQFTKVMNDPDVKTYMKANELGNQDVHELYRHFLVRMHKTVKKYGKQTCIWEGFARDGTIEVPKDIIVFEFESLYQLPNALIEDGYTVVNASWKPLYVVNEKKWEPKTIYDWNMWRFQNWWSRSPATDNPIQLAETAKLIGAQMCTWEQPQEVEFKSLRKRLPVMNERIWNTKKTIPYKDFMQLLESTDTVLSILSNDTAQDSLLIGHNHKEAQQ